MSRNKDTGKTRPTFSSMMENNKIVFVVSLVVAIICWCGVSIFQTPVIDKTFNDVKVNINTDDGNLKNSGLEVFGKKDFTISVTVRGLSYIVNSSSFTAENISVNASSAAVATAGTYDLPLTASIVGASGDIEIISMSAQTVKVNFDERTTKSFGLSEEIAELDDYSLTTGFIRENPRLSVETLKISGPAREMSKITGLKARVELSGKLEKTESYEAEIIAEGASGPVDLSNFAFDITEPVYITIPVKRMEKFSTAVDFTGMPQAYREDGIEYSVYPSEIDVSVILDSEGSKLNENNQILIGTVDFSQINNTVNQIKIKSDNASLTDSNFVVTIDMSSMDKRWLEIPVDVSGTDLPEGVTVTTASIKSVQIIGPAGSVKNLTPSSAYAVPVLDGAELTPGTHTVPAKIMLRTLTDSWIYGTYTMEIVVE